MEGAESMPLFLLFMVFSSFLPMLLLTVPPLMPVGVVTVARLGRCSA